MCDTKAHRDEPGAAAWCATRSLAASLSCLHRPSLLCCSLIDPFIALDLAAVHDAPRLGIERIALVQHGEIIPLGTSKPLNPCSSADGSSGGTEMIRSCSGLR